MARKPLVTRTITSTKVRITSVDTTTLNVSQSETILPRSYRTEDDALKVASKLFNNDTVKVLKVELLGEETALYGMDEDTFIANATILPNRK